jgi:hypothetical protein
MSSTGLYVNDSEDPYITRHLKLDVCVGKLIADWDDAAPLRNVYSATPESLTVLNEKNTLQSSSLLPLQQTIRYLRIDTYNAAR